MNYSKQEKNYLWVFSLGNAVFVSGVSHAGERIGICFFA